MGIRCYCPNGHRLNIKAFLAGRLGICPQCQARFRIPTESEPLRQTAGSPPSDSNNGPTDVAETPTTPETATAQPDITAAAADSQATPGTPTAQPAAAEPLSSESHVNPLADHPTAQPTTAQPTTAQPTTAQPTTVQPAAAQPAAVQPATVQPAAVQPTAQNAQPTQSIGQQPAQPADLQGPTTQPLGQGSHATQPVPAAPATPAATPPDPISEAPHAVWYVRPPTGGEFGPAKGDIMRKWVTEGRVTPDSLVWREGWSDWRLADGLFPNL